MTKLQKPQVLASGEETAYGLGWMLETVQLGGAPTRLAGHASRTLLGGSTSFLTFPERGIVVAVTTNISGKDTKSIALGIAQAFAEQSGYFNIPRQPTTTPNSDGGGSSRRSKK